MRQGPAPPGLPGGRRVLLVDDEPATIDVLRDGLEAEGWTVLVATSGAAALRAARAARPDFIVLDVGLPGENGFATCARLKRSVATAAIPVAFLSAMDASDGAERGRAAGGVAFIEKRPPWASVLEAIRALADGGRA